MLPQTRMSSSCSVPISSQDLRRSTVTGSGYKTRVRQLLYATTFSYQLLITRRSCPVHLAIALDRPPKARVLQETRDVTNASSNMAVVPSVT